MLGKHKVFISYHHDNDEFYRERFEALFANCYEIMVPNSVQFGDIDPNLPTDTVRRIIRDDYLKNSTVTVVLIGTQTWQRKHVDWEIASSIRQTQHNSRSGLIGIILPTHTDYNTGKYDRYTIPPRLYDNIDCGFAKIYNWSDDPISVKDWIEEAFKMRSSTVTLPDNSYQSFSNNRTGDRWW